MAKANIAILHYTGPPVIGGVENVITDHLRLLVEEGYHVQMIVGRGDARRTEHWETTVIPELDSDNPSNREIASALERGEIPQSFARLESRIHDTLLPVLRSADVLIVHNILNFHFNLPLSAALYDLVDKEQVPCTIAWCHDISRYVNPSSGAEQRYGFPWDLLRTYCPQIRYVTVSTARQSILAQIMRVSPEKIRVIPNGVSPELMLRLSEIGRYLSRKHDLLDADVILLMPIRITRAKNIEFALEVVARLRNLGLTPRLIVTGPPDPHEKASQTYFQKLVLLRSELQLEQEVVFLYEGAEGSAPIAIDSEGISEFYRIADIVFMPSLREGFGLPVLEAGLLDRTIFASRVPAVEEIGEEYVHIIEPEETPQRVAERIRNWAHKDNEHLLRRRVRREYTWQGIFERKIEPLIADCLAHPKEML